MSKDKLERAISLLRTTLESTADGILVVDRSEKITIFNQRFVKLWNMPKSALISRDDKTALNAILDQLKEPEVFLKKTENPCPDFLEKKDL